MSAICYPCENGLTESTLPALEERARSTSADLVRQRTRLSMLIDNFGKQRLKASPSTYAAMRAEVEQQELITEAAMQAQADAETTLANAQAAAQAQAAEEQRRQRSETIRAELDQTQIELSQLQALYGQLPERIAAARLKHSRLLSELASL